MNGSNVHYDCVGVMIITFQAMSYGEEFLIESVAMSINDFTKPLCSNQYMVDPSTHFQNLVITEAAYMYVLIDILCKGLN